MSSDNLQSPGIRLSKLGLTVVLAVALAIAPLALAERTHLKPGFNLFSPQQDVEVGRQVAQDAERKLPMLRDRRVDAYLTRLGSRLVSRAPGERYPYQFKAVNDSTINAFALPGGFLYVNRGAIEAADTEAQLAGVMGHEIGHVILRHGTNQASKAYAYQAPLALLGGVLGSNSVGAVLAQVGTGFAVNSILLKYSRDDERQADIMGVQLLYDNNYDPRALAQFFEKLESRGRGSDFFSDHPNPENRIQNIQSEIQRLGARRNFENDGSEFEQIKRYLASMPPAPKGSEREIRQNSGQRPRRSSGGSQIYENDQLRLRYPAEWRAYGRTGGFTIAPDGGLVDTREGSTALAYGVMMAVSEPRMDRHYRVGLEEATDQLIDQLQSANPSMNVIRDHQQMRVAGEPGMSTTLSNTSPVGGRETDWLVTVLRPEGLVYFVFVAPEREFSALQRPFEDMLSSVEFLH